MRAALLSLIAFAASIASASSGPAAATEPAAAPAIPASAPLKYHCQWTPRFHNTAPWTGDMSIKDNAQGIINGTYRSTSIKPDPFYGKIITVTGGLTGKDIRLSFGIVPSLTVRGQVVGNGITGSTIYNGGTLEFTAVLAAQK